MKLRPLDGLVGLLVVGLVAGLTHLLAVLLLPRVATDDAYDVLQAMIVPKHGRNTMVPLAPSRPGDHAVPFRDPATVQAVCFYDLSKAPVRVRATTEEGRLLMLSFRTPDGRIFYSMTDRAALRQKIDIRLVTGPQLATVVEGDSDDSELPEELRLRSPGTTGLVVATALVGRPDERREAMDRVAAVTCASEPIRPAS